MDLSLVAYTLSKFLITAVFCYRSQTFAEEICGHIIGDNDETEDAIKKDRFYLDKNNPLCCTGNITSWRVCYYGPNNSNNMKLYTVKYAVCRLIDGTQDYYAQVSNLTFNTTLRGKQSKSQQYAEIIRGGFNCYNESVDLPFAVELGDIIGACVVDPTGQGMLHQLDVVSDTEDLEPGVPQLHIYMHRSSPSNQNIDYEKACKMNMTLPATIEFNNQFSSVPRRLHLNAKISKIVLKWTVISVTICFSTECEALSANETTEPTSMKMNTTYMVTQATTVTETVSTNAEMTLTETFSDTPINEMVGNSPVQEQEDQALQETLKSGRLKPVLDLVGTLNNTYDIY